MAWIVPIVIVAVTLWITPDPNRPKEEFAAVNFEPTEIKIFSGRARKGADFFELRLVHPEGSIYFFRDPNPEPVQRVADIIPQGEALRVVYLPGAEGNAILEIAPEANSGKPYIAFGDVMAQYAERRRVVAVVAGLWFILGNAVLVLLWRKRSSS